ncbi:hypothetical protein ABW20_dc0110701 [Dactylellina cionopaga]|nr:hypothetical protein ABW20_dc0110701 [Dactylellina cionopaga]
MSTKQPATGKSQRVLACLLCQQRKVKCDRKFPCAHCVRADVTCIPATVARPRRRRFPERELLERLRHYEGLLRQNNVKFESLHTTVEDYTSPTTDGASASGTDRFSREKTPIRSKPMNLWDAMSQTCSGSSADNFGKTLDSDDDEADGDNNDDDDGDGPLRDIYTRGVHQASIKRAWDHMHQSENNDHLLFGSPKTNIDLSTLHPEQVQIFKLWQVYLENVDPLLKVTHMPTLQKLIIDAAGDVKNIKPTLEALIFSIYCVAISVRPKTDPRSLSSMIGVAIRLAQRMGLHNESSYAKCAALEAEMRRRLWWSLVGFDHRLCEMVDYKTSTLSPTWDCRTPLNVNDFDFRPEMKVLPEIHEGPTEAVFSVVRSEINDVIRYSAFHLDFTNPSLCVFVQSTRPTPAPEGSELAALEKNLQEKYLAFCNPENPFHFMTIWMARGLIVKFRLIEHLWRLSATSTQPTDAQRNAAISYALDLLDCDTRLMTSPLTQRYRWLMDFQFPFPAYIHLLQDLKRRPAEAHAENAWEVMSKVYETRIMNLNQGDRPLFNVFARIVLPAWDIREELFKQDNKPIEPPLMVRDIRKKLIEMKSTFPQNDSPLHRGGLSPNSEKTPLMILLGVGDSGPSQSVGEQDPTPSSSWASPGLPGEISMDIDVGLFDWNAVDWDSMHV